MNIRQKRAAALAKGQEMVSRIKSRVDNGGPDLNDAERVELKGYHDTVVECDEAIKAAAADDALFAAMCKSGAPRGSGGSKSDRLDFSAKGAADAVASRAETFGGFGVKSLLTAGSTATVPLDVGIFDTAKPAASIFDVIPAVLAEGGRYSFLRQASRVNAAAPVARGAEKPKSSATLTRVNGELSVVAHILEAVDTYDLSDVPALVTFVQNELGWGLMQAVANQVVNGDGTAPNLQGILNTSGIRVQTFAASAVITIRRALGQLEAAGYSPSAILINPSDWMEVETSLLTSGAFMLGNGGAGAPLDAVRRSLWGAPVALVPQLAAGTAVVLGDDAVSLFHDGTLKLDWDPSRGFGRNQIDARFEGRFGFAVGRPDAVVEAQLSA